MFQRILVAVDGSRIGGATVPVAVDLARHYGAKVTVVHVREHQKFEGEDVDLGPDVDAQKLVNGVVSTLAEAGVDGTGEIRHVAPGDTPGEIVKVAEQTDANLIVMGTRGMSELKSLVLGGVANKVVAHAHCPVLLVR